MPVGHPRAPSWPASPATRAFAPPRAARVRAHASRHSVWWGQGLRYPTAWCVIRDGSPCKFAPRAATRHPSTSGYLTTLARCPRLSVRCSQAADRDSAAPQARRGASPTLARPRPFARQPSGLRPAHRATLGTRSTEASGLIAKGPSSGVCGGFFRPESLARSSAASPGWGGCGRGGNMDGTIRHEPKGVVVQPGGSYSRKPAAQSVCVPSCGYSGV